MSITVKDLVRFLHSLDQDMEVRIIEPLQGDWDDVGYCYVEDNITHYTLMGTSTEDESFDIKPYDRLL